LGMGNTPPQIETSKMKSTIIRHREYVADVLSSEVFAIQATYPLNPGNSTTFPWLSQVASNYQEWRCNGMIFEFKSTAGDAIASDNNSLGEVIISTQYNPNTAPFATKIQMENEEFSTDIKPSESAIHGIECMRQQTPLSTQYIRSGTLTNPFDSLQFYDLGTTYVATSGQQTNGVNLGEIWVSYEIELIKPRIDVASDEGQAILTSHVQIASGNSINSLFNAAVHVGPGNLGAFTNGFTSVAIPANRLASGSVLFITLNVDITSSIAVLTFAPAFQNCNPKALFGGDGGFYYVTPSSGTSSNTVAIVMAVTIGNGAIRSNINFGQLFSTSGSTPTTLAGDLFLTQFNTNQL